MHLPPVQPPIHIEPVATPSLCRAVVPVFAEMLVHYHRTAEDAGAIERFLGHHLLVPKRTVEMLAARAADGAVMGFASYAVVIPGGGLATELFLKELYTAEAHRGRGVARALMRALALIARDLGCGRMRWTTGREDSYKAARRLYDSLGGRVQEDAILYAMPREAIDALADSAM
ncbi:MAG: GNAT family N-acetyltransferase [Azospirillaceae bacterium]